LGAKHQINFSHSNPSRNSPSERNHILAGGNPGVAVVKVHYAAKRVADLQAFLDDPRRSDTCSVYELRELPQLPRSRAVNSKGKIEGILRVGTKLREGDWPWTAVLAHEKHDHRAIFKSFDHCGVEENVAISSIATRDAW
jgi:hypothetical protein